MPHADDHFWLQHFEGRERYMDIRDTLSAEKAFINIPFPVFLMLTQSKVSAKARLLYILHWHLGRLSRNWKSQIEIGRAIDSLGISESGVRRAYAELAKRGLIDREVTPSGSQKVPVVEVLIPEMHRYKLLASPNRKGIGGALLQHRDFADTGKPQRACPEGAGFIEVEDACVGLLNFVGLPAPRHTEAAEHLPAALPDPHEPESDDIFGSEDAPAVAEPVQPAPYNVSLLEAEQKQRWWEMVQRVSEITWGRSPCSRGLPVEDARKRRVGSATASKVNARVRRYAPDHVAGEIVDQVLWCIEEGGLVYRKISHAVNIALSYIERAIWGRPMGMPDGWTWKRSRAA